MPRFSNLHSFGIAAAFALVSLAVAAGPATTAQVGAPESIVFVGDASGSMLSKMMQQKDEICSAVAELESKDQFDVIFFADSETPPNILFKGLLPATQENKQQFEKFMVDIRAAGSTDPLPAVKAAFQLQPATIVFATDGDFEDDAGFLSVIETVLRGSHVRMNTVLFSNTKKADKKALAMMQKLAAETGGRFRLVCPDGQAGR